MATLEKPMQSVIAKLPVADSIERLSSCVKDQPATTRISIATPIYCKGYLGMAQLEFSNEQSRVRSASPDTTQ